MNDLDAINSKIFDIQNQILELEHNAQIELVNKNKIDKINDLDHKTQIALSRPKLSANEYLNDASKLETKPIQIRTECNVSDSLFFDEEKLIYDKYSNMKKHLMQTIKNPRVLNQELKNIDILEKKDLNKLSFNEIHEINKKPKIILTVSDRKKYVAKLIHDRYLTRLHPSNKQSDSTKYKLISTKPKIIPKEVPKQSITELTILLDNLYIARDSLKNQKEVKEVKEIKEVKEVKKEPIRDPIRDPIREPIREPIRDQEPRILPITDLIGITNINLGCVEEIDFNDIDRMLDEFNDSHIDFQDHL